MQDCFDSRADGSRTLSIPAMLDIEAVPSNRRRTSCRVWGIRVKSSEAWGWRLKVVPRGPSGWLSSTN